MAQSSPDLWAVGAWAHWRATIGLQERCWHQGRLATVTAQWMECSALNGSSGTSRTSDFSWAARDSMAPQTRLVPLICATSRRTTGRLPVRQQRRSVTALANIHQDLATTSGCEKRITTY